MKYSYSWIKAKEIIHSLVVPSKNLKHFPNSREWSPKAAPASSGGQWGRQSSHGDKATFVWQENPLQIPFLPAPAEDTAHRSFSREGRTVSPACPCWQRVTAGDSRLCSGLLSADLCSPRHRAGGANGVSVLASIVSFLFPLLVKEQPLEGSFKVYDLQVGDLT